LSHLQTMLTHAEGCMVRYPKEISRFSAFGAEAAWRLGRWDVVEELNAKQDDGKSKLSFDCYLGQVIPQSHKPLTRHFALSITTLIGLLIFSIAHRGAEPNRQPRLSPP